VAETKPSSDVGFTGSEAGSYLRLIYFVYHSTLGFRVIKKKTHLLHLDDGGGRGIHEAKPSPL